MTAGHSALTHRSTLIMTLIACALLAFNLSILLTVQVVESQHVPKTCQCPQDKRRVHGPLSDFKVTPKGPNCLQDEIIVIQQKNNNHVCLSPEGPQGKRLMKCWQRMQRDGKDSKNCIRRQKQRPRQRKRKAEKIQEGHILTSNTEQMEAENLRDSQKRILFKTCAKCCGAAVLSYALNKPRT